MSPLGTPRLPRRREHDNGPGSCGNEAEISVVCSWPSDGFSDDSARPLSLLCCCVVAVAMVVLSPIHMSTNSIPSCDQVSLTRATAACGKRERLRATGHMKINDFKVTATADEQPPPRLPTSE